MWPRPWPARLLRSRLGLVDRSAPAAVLDHHDPRLLGPQPLDVGLRRRQAAEPERRHAAVRSDAPDRAPARAGLVVAGGGLAQLDLVVGRGLGDAPHSSALASTGRRSPSSLTSTTRSVPGVRRT